MIVKIIKNKYVSIDDYYMSIEYKDKEIERLNNIIEKIQNDMAYLDSMGINQVKPKIIWERIELLKGEDKK